MAGGGFGPFGGAALAMRGAATHRRQGRGGLGPVRALPAWMALSAAAPAPVAAAAFDPAFIAQTVREPFALAAVFLALIVFFWAWAVVRKLSRDELKARSRVALLESELNEVEAVLNAEPHVMVIWRGREEDPERIAGDLRGMVKVPASREGLLDFEAWLEPESASTLRESLAILRAAGTPFNIGIKTAEGELLDADGRTAGGMATLALRPLTGERRHYTEIAYDTRKLGKQVERLSAILDRAPFPVWLNADSGELQWVNRAYLEATECTDIDQAVARQAALVERRTPAGAAGPAPQRAYAVIAGSKRALDVYDLPLEGGGQVGYAVDVSPLEEAQKELKRHIRAHASTLDNLATAIAIFGPDQRLRFHNAAYAELWSLDPEWLATGPLDSEILDRLRELRRLPEQANFRDWKAKQLTAYTTLETRESWWHLPDSQTLRVVCEQHPFGGVTYLYENVTKQISLESRYNELIGVQRETLDNLHEGVALFGTDGCLRLYNPSYARFWNLDQEFLESHPHVDKVIARCQELLPDAAVWDELKYGVTSLSEARQPLQGRMSRADGMVLDHATVSMPDGNTLVTYVDMTASAGIERALRERNEALEAADALKTRFLSNISYNLRTPLTNINGFTEALIMGIAGNLAPKQLEYLQDIRTSSTELMAIIDAILDLTTIDAGAMELRLGEVDVASVLEDTANAMAERIDAKNLTVHVEIADDVGTFIGDDRRVRQILTHLLENAIGFSNAATSIRMGARREGEHVLLWVSDTGRGIDPEFQAQAFERFQARAVTGGHRGPGLGLALVKSFVELHHGQVKLLSQLKRGTTVICRFPVAGPPGDSRRRRRDDVMPTNRHLAS